MGRFVYRWRINLGVIKFNFSGMRYTSTTWGLGRVSYNTRTRRTTVDTPGRGYWRSNPRPRR